MRVFSLAVLPTSQSSLKGLNILVGPALKSIRGINDTAFDENLYWNSPENRTTNQYDIVKRPSTEIRGDRGQIIDDLLDLYVYADRDIRLSETNVGGSSLLRMEFPNEVKPGEKVQSRLHFTIPNALKLKDPNAPRTEYICELTYFNGYSLPVKDASLLLGGDECWIPVIARPVSPKEGTGFTVVFYAPPGFTKGDGFDVTTVEALETHIEDGSQAESRVKLLWQLEELLERDRVDPCLPITCRSSMKISGSLLKSDDGKQIEGLKRALDAAETRIEKLKSEVRIATIVAVAGALVAIVGILISLVH